MPSRVCILGLLVSLCATGCAATSASSPTYDVSTTAEHVTRIKTEIARFYWWLRASKRLLLPVPRYGGWPESREIDPKTLKPIPKSEPPPLKERLEEKMKDPKFREQWALGEEV